jgi:hypothetical protein
VLAKSENLDVKNEVVVTVFGYIKVRLCIEYKLHFSDTRNNLSGRFTHKNYTLFFLE